MSLNFKRSVVLAPKWCFNNGKNEQPDHLTKAFPYLHGKTSSFHFQTLNSSEFAIGFHFLIFCVN